MKFKTLAVLALTVLSVSSLAFAGNNKMLADDSSSQAQPSMGGTDNSQSGSAPSSTDSSGNMGGSQDSSMPPSDDSTGGGTDTGTGDDDY